MNLRKLRLGILIYAALDLFIGGYNAGFLPLSIAQGAGTTTLLAQGGVGVSCNAITVSTSINPGLAGGCTSLALVTSGGTLPGNYTWQVITTGSPATLTVNFMGSLDNVTWTQIDTTSTTSGATKTVANANSYRFLGCVPATLTGGTSPTVTCQISVTSTAVSGGTGTVTHTGSALTLNAVVLGNGAADTTVSTGITTNGASELDLGLNGTASGVLGWNGSTSGKATCTAPAVAGTPANPVACTNAFTGPTGALNSITYGDAANSEGLGFGTVGGGSGATLVASSNAQIGVANVGSGIFITSGNGYGWTSGALSAALDTNLNRGAAGLVQVGTTALNELGLFRPGTDSCRVTVDITLPVNTATTICTWSLPAVAKAWAWQCQIPWVISAGTGTNTLAIIANPSQTPTAATNGSAEIKTTNTNTATEATTAISASGATTLLTSGTITPGATVFMSSTSGTLLASATAGTFAIQMTAAGTTATAAAKAGATCYLY